MSSLDRKYKTGGGEVALLLTLLFALVGVPAIFPRLSFSELAELRGDQGARMVLERNNYRLVRVPMSNAAIDLDTPEDLATLTQRFQRPESTHNSAAAPET